MHISRTVIVKAAKVGLPLLLCLLLLGGAAAFASNTAKDTPTDPIGFTFIGEATFPTGYRFRGTEVGGLSDITYDPLKKCFYAVSDDRSRTNPARFYALTIDLKDGRLNAGDVVFTDVITLRDEKGRAYQKDRIDPEGIALAPEGLFIISSEGDALRRIAPFVNGFDLKGQFARRFKVPEKFMPAPQSGIRNNAAFESLTISPDQRFLYTAVENALLQDGPKAGAGQKSPSRMIKYDLKSGNIVAEYVYMVDAPAKGSQSILEPSVNGLVALIAIGPHSLLSLERSYSLVKGVTVKIFQLNTRNASNIAPLFSLLQSGNGAALEGVRPIEKDEVLNIGRLVPVVDNLEGMTFGPQLPDGRRSLILVSDNNFKIYQKTQFIAFAVPAPSDSGWPLQDISK